MGINITNDLGSESSLRGLCVSYKIAADTDDGDTEKRARVKTYKLDFHIIHAGGGLSGGKRRPIVYIPTLQVPHPTSRPKWKDAAAVILGTKIVFEKRLP